MNVCLSCFNGGCAGERNHAEHHHKLSKHPLILNIKRTKKPRAEASQSGQATGQDQTNGAPQRDEPPQKMSKLAIAAETEADVYDTHTAVICYECGNKEIERAAGNVWRQSPH